MCLGDSVTSVGFKMKRGRSLFPLLLVMVFGRLVFGGLTFGGARADIIIDGGSGPALNSSGQFQIVTAPGDYTQTLSFTDSIGFAVDINATNGPNGAFRIDPGVTLTGSGGSTLVIRAATTLSTLDVQGTLRATSFNALSLNASGSISDFSNSGTIGSSSGSSAAVNLAGTVTNFSNSGTIEQTSSSARTALIIDQATTATNDTTGTISSANGMAVRLGFGSAATIGSFINDGRIDGGTIGIELGRTVGSTAGLTNSGTITAVSDGLQVRNGSELSSFDNTGGVIESTGVAGAGLHLSEDQDSAITNSGTIRSTSTGNGLLLDTEAQTRDFTNSGTISSASGTAIVAQTAMTGHSGGFVNSGSVTGGGGTAIDAQDAFTLTNSGAVSGDISHTGSGALAVSQTAGSITGNITSTANAAHSLSLSGGTVNGNIVLDGLVANSFTLDGTAVTGNVDLGDGSAHAANLRGGSISGTLDIGTGTTTLSIDVTGGDALSVGALATNNATVTNITGAGDVSINNFTAAGTVNQTAGRLTGASLSVSTGGSFTQSGASVLGSTAVTLNGTAALNLNGTTARVTGTVSGGAASRVAVNGSFSSENSFNVGRFEVGNSGTFNMEHDVTVSAASPTAFANFGTLAVATGDAVTINGNYTQDANGVFQVGVTSDTVFGKLAVTGTANLPSSARIDVIVADANFLASDMQGIITAGTLNSDGTFSVTDNSILFDFGAEVAGNAVDLCLAAAGGACASGGGGSRGVQDAVVASENWPGVDAAIVFDDLIDAFVAQGTSGSSGMDDVIRSLGALGAQQSVSGAVSDTLPLLTASAAIPIRNSLSSTRRIVRSRLSDNDWLPSEDQAFADKHIWAIPFYTRQDHDDSRAVSGFSGRSQGLAFGADANVGTDTHLGVAFAYSGTDVDSNDKRSSADIETYQLTGYGRYALTDFTEVDVQVGLGLSETDGQRTIAFLDDMPTARSQYDSMSFHLGGGIGHMIELGSAAQFVPSLHIDYMRLDSESYTEAGAGALNLDAESSELEALEFGVSGKLRYRINSEASLVASFGAVYDAFNEQPKVTSRFVGGGEAFVTSGLDASPWTGHLGLSLPITLDDQAHVALRYDVEARRDYSNQTVSMKVGWSF